MESILIVDDDINLCTVLSEELKAVGYETSYLSDGEEAAKVLTNWKGDLLLLDLMMPGIDGFDLLQKIKNHHNSHPKVIVLTAYADVKSAIESARLGATDFISKPYDFDELLITIRKVLQSYN
ncbi:MAG: response regulator [Ignavibacteriaceae bacterium]|jgi:two-component system NtrC family response regulator|nr:response regulator [Ignavibacteriaceae bacterium]